MAASNRKRESGCVGDLAAVLERLAPGRFAAEWDNVGLLTGSAAWPCRRVLVTVDLTMAVVREAIAMRAAAVVAYHPPIFKPVARFRTDRTASQEAAAAEALAQRIAVVSPHTALDAAPGGTNDVIAALCGVRGLRPFASGPAEPGPQCKVVVFVPAEQVERVAAAVFDAGAGLIGHYRSCSFRIPGTGTFFGDDAAAPVVGQKGRLETVAEIRLEAVAPKAQLPRIVAAIRASHPYEEPAFDVYPLMQPPSPTHGAARLGELARPTTPAILAAKLKRATGAAHVALVGEPRRAVRRVLVCVGAAGGLPFETPGESIGDGDVIVTGEIRHHDALRCQRHGAAAIALGHWASERPGVAALARRLGDELPGVVVRLSRADRDPFRPGP